MMPLLNTESRHETHYDLGGCTRGRDTGNELQASVPSIPYTPRPTDKCDARGS